MPGLSSRLRSTPVPAYPARCPPRPPGSYPTPTLLRAPPPAPSSSQPSNTLLSAASGTAKLADCGLARPLDGGERPAYTHAVATRWYRAPELLYGARAYGPAVDVWALGLVFAELLGEEGAGAGQGCWKAKWGGGKGRHAPTWQCGKRC